MTYATRKIALASGVMPDFTPEQTVEAAAKGGWDAVGVWVEPGEWTDATTRRMKQSLSDFAIPAVDVEVLWIKPGASNPDHFRILDIGAELGAPNALVVSSDPDMGATTAKYAELCEHGRKLGMRVSLEFGMFTNVQTIDQALAVIKAAENPAAALLVDPIHLSRSGGSPADVARVPRELFAYAQFCDAVAVGPNPHDFDAIIAEAVDGRLQTGEGALPLRELLDVMPADIVYSIELRSKPLRDNYPDPIERSRVTADITRRFLANLDAQRAG